MGHSASIRHISDGEISRMGRVGRFASDLNVFLDVFLAVVISVFYLMVTRLLI